MANTNYNNFVSQYNKPKTSAPKVEGPVGYTPYQPPVQGPVQPPAAPKTTTPSTVGKTGYGYWDTKGWVAGGAAPSTTAQSTPSTTPAPTTTPTGTTPIATFYDPTPDTGTSNGSYDLTTKDEDKIRRDTLQRYQGQIDATKAAYGTLLGQTQLQGTGRLGESTAQQARGGLMGSDFGAAMTDKTRAYNQGQEQEVLQSQATAIAAIMAQAEGDSRSDIAARRSAKQYGYEETKKYNAEEQTRKTANVKKLALSMVRQGVDPKTMGEQLKQLAKTYKVSENDIINSYFEEKDVEDKALAKAEQEALKFEQDGMFSLSEGQAQYDSKGNLIASRAKTYAPKATSGGGGYGSYGTEANAVAKDWASAITEGRAKLTDIPASEKGLRTAVAAELANPQMTQAKALELQTNIDLVDDLLNSNYQANVGLRGPGSYIPGTEAQTAKNYAQQLGGILALDNRQKLKGSGAISDFEARTLERAASALGINSKGRSNLSNEEFARIAGEVQQTFRDALARSGSQPQANIIDPEIQELLDQGYTEEQINELINAQ